MHVLPLFEPCVPRHAEVRECRDVFAAESVCAAVAALGWQAHYRRLQVLAAAPEELPQLREPSRTFGRVCNGSRL